MPVIFQQLIIKNKKANTPIIINDVSATANIILNPIFLNMFQKSNSLILN